MTRRTLSLAAGVGTLALAGACWFTRGAAADVPTAVVERGAFVDASQIRGELKSARSVTITAPADAGDLRIVKLVKSGTLVKRGDVLIEFDASSVARTLAEKRSEVRGYDAELDQAKSEARAKEQEDLTAETKARYDVERAKLDYSAKEILSRVDAEQKRLLVGDAEQKLAEASAKLASGRAGASAKRAGVASKREKAQFDLDKAERQLGSLAVHAPSDGMIAILRNWNSGNFMNPQDFKEGDQAWPGASIAELPDLGSLYAGARVDEIERGRLVVGQPVSIRLESLPDAELSGHIQNIGALAKADFTSWPPPRTFEVNVALDRADPRLRTGMTATLRISTETLPNVLMVPSQALFASHGEDVVYVMRRGRAQRQVVSVDRRSADKVVLQAGVTQGERVALKQPEEVRQ